MTKQEEIDMAWAINSGRPVTMAKADQPKLGKVIFADRSAIDKCYQDYLDRKAEARRVIESKKRLAVLADGKYHNLADLRKAA